MTVTFQVGDREFGGAGNLDVDFWVRFFLVLGAGVREKLVFEGKRGMFR